MTKRTLRISRRTKERNLTKDDIKRATLHFPLGIFTAWLGTFSPVVCIIFGIGFLTYEVIEDWRIKDRSYKDVFGYLIGIGIGSFIFWCIGWY